MSDVDLRPGPGISVVQASAGTGKTYVVTSLAVTAIADGRPLNEILLMTFSRAATGELRSRVWERLVTVESEVQRCLDSGVGPVDEVAVDLCSASEEIVRARHGRLRRAIADFDAATITTLHGFCHDVLGHLGFLGDLDREVAFIEDTRDLIEAVVDDLLVQRFHHSVDFRLDQDEARSIARAVTTHSHADIVPEPTQQGLAHFRRARFARAIRQRIEARKRELSVMGYDDLLLRLDECLRDHRRDDVRSRLQERFGFVVVDEFQDTDTVQWSILDNGFGDSDTTLVLVGDPKQAIYSFRGADVEAYLAARGHDPDPAHLAVNQRSDAGVLAALDTLFGEATLGHDAIVYESTSAAAHHLTSGLDTDHKPEPFRLRQVRRDSFEPADLYDDAIRQPQALEFVADDLAADVAYRLRKRSVVIDHRRDGTSERRDLTARDIAVLVRRHAEADQVRAALARLGVPAVVNATGSVFASDATDEWLTLLSALETPGATTRVHSAVIGSFFGWSAEELVGADDAAWNAVHDRLHLLRTSLEERGPAAVLNDAASLTDLPARVLSTVGGQRLLTDLEHIGRLLHEFSTTADRAPSTLISWLRERRAREEREADQSDRQRQLDTDADAVQIWTMHRCKGLEFPIVYLPYLWRNRKPGKSDIPYYHDPETGRRCVDVGGPTGDDYAAHQALSAAEQAGEEMRLAYVALTRARHQVVAWWAPATTSVGGPLGTLAFTPTRTGGRRVAVPSDDGARNVFDQMAVESKGTIRVETAVGRDDLPMEPGRDVTATLSTRTFDRSIDRVWKRTSYSGMTHLAHAAARGGAAVAVEAPEHDERGLEDEGVVEDDGARLGGPASVRTADEDGAAVEATLRAVPSLFGELAGGASFGTMVHEVLEHTDFAAADLDAEVAAALAGQLRGGDAEPGLLHGLVAAIETPLGASLGGTRLRDIPRSDRLDELHFEFPLAGGDSPVGSVTMSDIATVLARHLPDDDILASYPAELDHPELSQSVHGYLSGSIDLVARIDGRYVVADYKSNWLGVEGEELSAWHYRPDAMAAAMIRAHYPLQALLYSVALHRFLRSRLVDYSPDAHLGGVLYLFLRGMVGVDTPEVAVSPDRPDVVMPCGVFTWNPPSAAILALSDLLDTGAVPPAGGTT